MEIPLTLNQFVQKNQPPQTSGAFTSIIEDVALGCRMTASELRYGTFKGLMQKGSSTNKSGDQQVPLDIHCNEIFISLGENNPFLAAVVSEELEEPYFYDHPEAKYVLVIDPLDGSGNLDINAPVATIFSICQFNGKGNLLQSMQKPLAAGICNYGLKTSMMLTTGESVHGFTQDLESGVFFHTESDVSIPEKAKEVAINFSNRKFWNFAVKRYVDECFEGEDGPRGKYFNTRWYASAAAELNRILHRGGSFLYPACSNGKPQGVLRKVYEAYPMAFLVEAAGGLATDGEKRILDVEATDFHEKTPFAMGSKEEIEILKNYHQSME